MSFKQRLLTSQNLKYNRIPKYFCFSLHSSISKFKLEKISPSWVKGYCVEIRRKQDFRRKFETNQNKILKAFWNKLKHGAEAWHSQNDHDDIFFSQNNIWMDPVETNESGPGGKYKMTAFWDMVHILLFHFSKSKRQQYLLFAKLFWQDYRSKIRKKNCRGNIKQISILPSRNDLPVSLIKQRENWQNFDGESLEIKFTIPFNPFWHI